MMKSWDKLSKKQLMIKKGWAKCGLGDHLWENDFQMRARKEVILRNLLSVLPIEEPQQPENYYDEPIADVNGEKAMELCILNPEKLQEDDENLEIENEMDDNDYEEIRIQHQVIISLFLLFIF